MKEKALYADHVFLFFEEVASALRGSSVELADSVEYAKKFYIVPLTSEFYGVAMQALRKVIDSRSGALTSQQLEQARIYVDRIKSQYFST